MHTVLDKLGLAVRTAACSKFLRLAVRTAETSCVHPVSCIMLMRFGVDTLPQQHIAAEASVVLKM